MKNIRTEVQKEQRTVAFEEDAKKKEPARTFTFDTKKLLER